MVDNSPAYLILTWGCQMNDDDSRQMASLLEQMGYRKAVSEADADVVMLNTCSVRANPEQKVRSKLGELRLLKIEKPSLIICVCGCMAQREGRALIARAPQIDIVLGTASIPELPMLIEKVKRGGGRAFALDMPDADADGQSHTKRLAGDAGLKAFVPVMYGCNNYCAYCVVPYARGPERSRFAEEVVGEVTELVVRGCREVTLVGQNVNSYGRSSVPQQDPTDPNSPVAPCVDFAELLTKVNAIDGLERIRFITSHPKDLSVRLIEAIRSLPKVCEHLHLPLQSGDDEILRRMGRGYTFEHYLSLVRSLRDCVPGIALTTDIMVGFPGETESQFQNTLEAVKSVRYDSAFMFVFNARPGTAAASMEGQIDSATKSRRLKELIDLQNAISAEKASESIGSVFEVLVEGPSEKDVKKLTGYNRTNRTVNFVGNPELKGRVVSVRAIKAHPWGFTGELVDS
jgi:tRNA-2-methylthio-N6-dimethylallyladenosine synthase